ncbi:transcriptional regulator [Acinetobacter baumannii]|uniref:transcriptional regulator n=1 Tax=Acinetobacter baumannii TaxID=470 RepID=UPI0034CF3F49
MVEDKLINDFQRFIRSLDRESDRGLPLISAAVIEEKLHDTLKAFLSDVSASKKILNDFNAPLGTFSSKIDTCYALGLIDEFEYKEINLIRKIRNEFAHTVYDASFDIKKIHDLCITLESNLPCGIDPKKLTARFRFKNSVICLLSRLYYRPEFVQKEKRQSKVWVNPDQVRWRSVVDEPIPKDQTVLVLARKQTKKTR